MKNFYSPIAALLAIGVQTLDDAERYFSEVQGEYFVGVPGVAMSDSCFSDFAVELEHFGLTSPKECGNLWVFVLPSGGAFITTGLHHPRPGVALSEFLQARQLSAELRSFLTEWRRVVGAYFALKCLYVPTYEEAIERATHSGGRN